LKLDDRVEKIIKTGEERLNFPSNISSDVATINDKLGYRIYSHAIYRFLTHQNTSPPLTISIKAPWGGGKTSIMRMLQATLDPRAPMGFTQSRDENESFLSTPLTMDAVVNQLNKYMGGLDFQVESLGEGGGRITVWFNPWKYEGQEQIWAALAHEIITQITNRLSVSDRIRFWIELNRGRLEQMDLPNKMNHDIRNLWLKKARSWAWTYLSAFGVSAISGIISISDIPSKISPEMSLSAMVGSVAFGAFQNVFQKWQAGQEVKGEPAVKDETIRDYLDIPDYSDKLGLSHKIEEDLTKILRFVAKDYGPVVIFIDDLDRCSPERVSDVMKALNRFLAGEMPDCFFILGMEPIMVAAALYNANIEVIKATPKYLEDPNFEYRFLDKFVQLPIEIPPPQEEDLANFHNSLMSHEVKPKLIKEEIESMDEEITKNLPTNDLYRASMEILRKYLPDNPRASKRMVNMLKFEILMMAAKKSRGLNVPTITQVAKWIYFSQNWPSLARWILDKTSIVVPKRRDFTENTLDNSERKLSFLVTVAKTAKDVNDWSKTLSNDIKDMKKSIWEDPKLYEFFKAEARLGAKDTNMKITEGAEKNVY